MSELQLINQKHLLTNLHLDSHPGFQQHSITPAGNSSSAYALISVHGDPTAEIGRDGAGGQNIYVRELGLSLARRGCLVDIFTRREHPDQPEVVNMAPGCRTIRLTAGPKEFIHRNELFPYLSEFVESWLNFQNRSGRAYALLHTNYWLSAWVGLQLKAKLSIPQVHTFHSIGAVKYRDLENPPQIFFTRHDVEKSCLEQVDCVISTSPQEVDDLRTLISRNGRVKIIPCGIDTTHFGSVSQKIARCKLGISPQTRLVMYVGRFDPRKGIETLVDACSLLPKPFQLYIVGGSREGSDDWHEQIRIQNLVNQRGLEDLTIFTGQVSQKHLPTYYAAADVCVVPSYYEPFGLVALEAMAAGTPVVASQVGGLCHTVVHGKTGLLVPPCNPNKLAVAIWEILSQQQLMRTYGKSAQAWVRSRFSVEAVAEEVHKLYQSLTLSSTLVAASQTPSLTRDLQSKVSEHLINLKLDSSGKSTELSEEGIEALDQILQILSDQTIGSI